MLQTLSRHLLQPDPQNRRLGECFHPCLSAPPCARPDAASQPDQQWAHPALPALEPSNSQWMVLETPSCYHISLEDLQAQGSVTSM